MRKLFLLFVFVLTCCSDEKYDVSKAESILFRSDFPTRISSKNEDLISNVEKSNLISDSDKVYTIAKLDGLFFGSNIAINEKNDEIFFVSRSFRLHKYDIKNKKTKQQSGKLFSDLINTTKTIVNYSYKNDVIVVTSNSGGIEALDGTNLKPLWSKKLFEGVFAESIFDDERVFVKTISGRIFSLDAKTGSEIAMFEPNRLMSDNSLFFELENKMFIFDNDRNGKRKILVTSFDNNISILDLNNLVQIFAVCVGGKNDSITDFKGQITDFYVSDDVHYIFAKTMEGYHLVKTSDRSIVWSGLGRVLSNVIFEKNHVILVNPGGYLVAQSVHEGGAYYWSAKLGSGSYHLVEAKNNKLLVFLKDKNNISKLFKVINLQNGHDVKIENDIQINSFENIQKSAFSNSVFVY